MKKMLLLLFAFALSSNIFASTALEKAFESAKAGNTVLLKAELDLVTLLQQDDNYEFFLNDDAIIDGQTIFHVASDASTIGVIFKAVEKEIFKKENNYLSHYMPPADFYRAKTMIAARKTVEILVKLAPIMVPSAIENGKPDVALYYLHRMGERSLEELAQYEINLNTPQAQKAYKMVLAELFATYPLREDDQTAKELVTQSKNAAFFEDAKRNIIGDVRDLVIKLGEGFIALPQRR